MTAGERGQIQTRWASRGDAKTFERFVDALHCEMLAITRDPLLEPNREFFVQQWLDWFSTNGTGGVAGRVFIAEESKPLGMIAALISQAPFGSSTVPFIGVIALWWVDPEWRGSGFGKRLLSDAEQWFKERNVRYAEVQYMLANTDAANRWRRRGFVPFSASARKDLGESSNSA